MKDGWKGWVYNVTEEEMEWLNKCYVGKMMHTNNAELLQEKMATEGITSVKLIPIGGDSVLIKVEEDEDFMQLAKDAEGYLQDWFSAFSPWTPMEVARDRFPWVRCQGVPLHVKGY